MTLIAWDRERSNNYSAVANDRLAQLNARRKSGMAPWEVEVMFYSRAVKRAHRPIRVNASDLVAGCARQPTPAELRATRKSLPVTI